MGGREVPIGHRMLAVGHEWPTSAPRVSCRIRRWGIDELRLRMKDFSRYLSADQKTSIRFISMKLVLTRQTGMRIERKTLF